MNRAVLRIALAALALAFAADVSLAATKSNAKKRKVGFFASLFGETTPRRKVQRQRRSVFGNNWWNDDEGDVRIITGSDLLPEPGGKKRRNYFIDEGDPEGDPGLGMGNITYVAEKLERLGGAYFADARPAAPAEAAIYDALSDGELGIRVRADARDAIHELYKSQNFRPLWLAGGQLSERGQNLLTVLAAAGEEGLAAQNYLPPGLVDFASLPPAGDAPSWGRLDVGLTAAALRYARDASGGQFDPRRLSLYNDITPAWVPASQALRVLAWSPFPAAYLASLHPRHKAYAAMKAELARVRAEGVAPQEEPIARGKLVKAGQSDERIPLVRQRLQKRGFGDSHDSPEDPLVLDELLSARLREFQRATGVKASGMLGPKSIEALNRDVKIDELPRLLDNMERLRWLPKDLGTRFVFVNQPAFSVAVMDNGQEVWRSRVIVGKPMTQTSAFHDEIETVVFNPSWGVPQSIIANEYLPKLRDDPGYLDRIGFKVTDAQGRVVPSYAVDWWSYGNKVPYGIQQPPGRKNALGELKFLFPNSHDIYMHDTPSRELFDRDERAFSHGCVRVQNPREFAQVLLGWDSIKVDENVEGRKSQSVKLQAKVPVHITYFTAWPDETGKIQYFNDIYGRDKTLENARSSITLAQR